MSQEARELALAMADRIADKLSNSHREAIREASRDRPVYNAGPLPQAPMVVSTGGQQPLVIDYRALGESIATAMTPTFNQQSRLVEELIEQREMLRQLVESVASMEIRPTINVPQSAVNVEMPMNQARTFHIEHDDGTKSRVSVE
jgi:hypothetical protein